MPSSWPRHLGKANAYIAATAAPTATIIATRIQRFSTRAAAQTASSAPPSAATDSHTGESASHTGCQLSFEAKTRKQSAVPPASVAA